MKKEEIPSMIFAWFVTTILLTGIVFFVKSCNDGIERQDREILTYLINHPSYYSITYIDGSKDTIKVWDDDFNAYDNGGTFRDGIIVIIQYTPWKKYSELPCLGDREKIYNILKYKKIK